MPYEKKIQSLPPEIKDASTLKVYLGVLYKELAEKPLPSGLVDAIESGKPRDLAIVLRKIMHAHPINADA